MLFRMVLFVWEFVLDVVAVSRMTEDEKDLEILLLRQQLRIVERKQDRGPQILRWQKVPLAVLANRLKQKASHSRKFWKTACGCSSRECQISRVHEVSDIGCIMRESAFVQLATIPGKDEQLDGAPEGVKRARETA